MRGTIVELTERSVNQPNDRQTGGATTTGRRRNERFANQKHDRRLEKSSDAHSPWPATNIRTQGRDQRRKRNIREVCRYSDGRVEQLLSHPNGAISAMEILCVVVIGRFLNEHGFFLLYVRVFILHTTSSSAE